MTNYERDIPKIIYKKITESLKELEKYVGTENYETMKAEKEKELDDFLKSLFPEEKYGDVDSYLKSSE
jgi:hypothetical protein